MKKKPSALQELILKVLLKADDFVSRREIIQQIDENGTYTPDGSIYKSIHQLRVKGIDIETLKPDGGGGVSGYRLSKK